MLDQKLKWEGGREGGMWEGKREGEKERRREFKGKPLL